MERRIPETTDEMVREIWQGVYGIPGTEDDGLFGIVKEQGQCIAKTKKTLNILIAFLSGSGILGGSIYASIVL